MKENITTLAEEARIGSAKARTQLLARLEDGDPAVRARTVQALRDPTVAGKAVSDVVAALTQRLNDTDPDVRSLTVHALAHLAPDKRTLTGTLLPYLSDDSAQMRAYIVEAFQMLGQPVPDVLAAVRQAWRDPASQVRYQAISALAALDPSPEIVRTWPS